MSLELSMLVQLEQTEGNFDPSERKNLIDDSKVLEKIYGPHVETYSEAYLEPCQISMMELFCKVLKQHANMQTSLKFINPCNLVMDFI